MTEHSTASVQPKKNTTPTARVLFVAHATASRQLGGADRSMLELATALQERWGVAVTVLAPHPGALVEACEARGLMWRVADYGNCTASPLGGSGVGRVPWRMAGRVTAPLRQALWGRVVAKVVREVEAEVVWSNSSVVAAGRIGAWLTRRPHIWHVRELPDDERGITPVWGWSVHRWLIRTSRRVVAISHCVAEASLGGERDPVVVIHNPGLSAAGFDKACRPLRQRSPGEPLRAVLLGGLSRAKGQAEAIEAVATLRDEGTVVELSLVGGGDASPLQELIDRLGVGDRVVLAGRVDTPWESIASADVLLACAAWEPLGRTIVEGMAVRRAVVARAAGGLAEQVVDGETGLLYKDHTGLVAALRRLAAEPDLLARLAEAGHQAVRRDRLTDIVYRRFVNEVLEPTLGRPLAAIENDYSDRQT